MKKHFNAQVINLALVSKDQDGAALSLKTDDSESTQTISIVVRRGQLQVGQFLTVTIETADEK